MFVVEFLARQATIISYANGRDGLLTLEDIQEAMARSRSKEVRSCTVDKQNQLKSA